MHMNSLQSYARERHRSLTYTIFLIFPGVLLMFSTLELFSINENLMNDSIRYEFMLIFFFFLQQ